MITINPNFAGFKSFFKNLLTIYQRETDTYKDINKEGLFERYMAVFGEHIDTELSSEIENYLNVIDASICEEKFTTHLSDVLGNPPDIFKDLEQYRNLLTYIVSVYKVKGTNKGYKLFFYIFGFDVTITETEPIEISNIYDDGNFYDDSEIYEPDTCARCSTYTISVKQIIDNGFIIDSSTIALLRDAITFNEPINAVLNNFTIVTLIEDDLGTISFGETQTSDELTTDLSLQLDTLNITTLDEEIITILTQTSNIPTINIEWENASTTDDQVCSTSGCTYYIGLNYADIDNDITTVALQQSIDGGVNWTTIVSNMLTMGSPTVYPVVINVNMDNYYRAIVTDSQNNSVTSNTIRAYSTYVLPTEKTDFYYEGLYASDNLASPGPGSVVFIDEFGMNSVDDLWIGECVLIQAYSIISVTNAEPCIPFLTSYYQSLGGNPPPPPEPGGPEPEGYEDSGFVTYYTNEAQTTQTVKEFRGTRYHFGTVTPAPILPISHYGIISVVNAVEIGV